jgi:predicted DNA-binding WGR domain protein
MVEAKLQIVLRRQDSTRNVSRYYVLAIEPSLYGDAALVRAWGRIGSLGRQRLDLYATTEAAGEALEVWLARKMRRGYAPAASEADFGGQFKAAISDCR